MLRAVVSLIALGIGVSSHAAIANPLKSLYTTVELKACKQIRRHSDGGAWQCAGLPGFPVYVAEGDLRQFVSAGPRAERRRAATQTLGPFNSIFEPGSDRATIEWRFVRRSGQPIPFATIVRFHTSTDGRKHDVLVVSKVGERETCHVAHVDARAHTDAIALARQIADQHARSFDCRQDPSTQ
jgi:hypothetical protein